MPGRPEGGARDLAALQNLPARRVEIDPDGPILVEGPVEISTPQGVRRENRFLVAICACRRSRRYPLCDGSHLRRPVD